MTRSTHDLLLDVHPEIILVETTVCIEFLSRFYYIVIMGQHGAGSYHLYSLFIKIRLNSDQGPAWSLQLPFVLNSY